ncbi:DUF7541 family protein [Salinilacihabitans rarus]|uniref:DUF7541 family protein n=1 Tax=Salinilacihabitans rarus TaxID=2961596 RepID=UPI0020C92E46|nr:hypothetical protein [Salinilacihabitans rarus]
MSDRSARAASPWPLLVALGLVLSEVGIVVDLFPVAVGGLVLFAWSVAGILAESGHVASPRALVAGFGGLFVLAGAAMVGVDAGAVPAGPAEGLVGLSSRGLAVAVAGAVAVVVGVGGRLRD